MPALAEKYRPHELCEVIGQEKAVTVLERVDIAGRGVYITGKSGTGKTTIARILANRIAGHALCITELVGRELTRSWLREWHDKVRFCRPLHGTGWALIVNESHGMQKPAIEILLDILESLPDYAVVIFTTTYDGADLFEEQLDASPFRSRCLTLSLAQRGITDKFAEFCQRIAITEGLDGDKPLSAYKNKLNEFRNNLREMIGFIEQGGML